MRSGQYQRTTPWTVVALGDVALLACHLQQATCRTAAAGWSRGRGEACTRGRYCGGFCPTIPSRPHHSLHLAGRFREFVLNHLSGFPVESRQTKHLYCRRFLANLKVDTHNVKPKRAILYSILVRRTISLPTRISGPCLPLNSSGHQGRFGHEFLGISSQLCIGLKLYYTSQLTLPPFAAQSLTSVLLVMDAARPPDMRTTPTTEMTASFAKRVRRHPLRVTFSPRYTSMPTNPNFNHSVCKLISGGRDQAHCQRERDYEGR